jgi:hypothetical protein
MWDGQVWMHGIGGETLPRHKCTAKHEQKQFHLDSLEVGMPCIDARLMEHIANYAERQPRALPTTIVTDQPRQQNPGSFHPCVQDASEVQFYSWSEIEDMYWLGVFKQMGC